MKSAQKSQRRICNAMFWHFKMLIFLGMLIKFVRCGTLAAHSNKDSYEIDVANRDFEWRDEMIVGRVKSCD